MRLIIDGDACPDKDSISRIALKYDIDMYVFIDYAHVLEDNYYKIITCEVGHDLCSRNEQRVVGDADDSFEFRHSFGIDFRPNHVACKKEFRLRVVHDVVYLLSFELVQNGYSHCAVALYS